MYIKFIFELFVLGFYINESFGIEEQENLLKSTVEYILRKSFGTDVSVLLLLSSSVQDESEHFLDNENLPG